MQLINGSNCQLEPLGFDRSDGKQPDAFTIFLHKAGNLFIWKVDLLKLFFAFLSTKIVANSG